MLKRFWHLQWGSRNHIQELDCQEWNPSIVLQKPAATTSTHYGHLSSDRRLWIWNTTTLPPLPLKSWMRLPPAHSKMDSTYTCLSNPAHLQSDVLHRRINMAALGHGYTMGSSGSGLPQFRIKECWFNTEFKSNIVKLNTITLLYIITISQSF